jgi:large subunit ribosomal protein L22
MGKPKQERELSESQAMAMARLLRTSPRKLNLVAQLIRGMKADQALNQLSFSRRRIAKDVKKVLMSAIANAENNHDLDVASPARRSRYRPRRRSCCRSSCSSR